MAECMHTGIHVHKLAFANTPQVQDERELKIFEEENPRLKKLVAEPGLDDAMLRVPSGNGLSKPGRRALTQGPARAHEVAPQIVSKVAVGPGLRHARPNFVSRLLYPLPCQSAHGGPPSRIQCVGFSQPP
jgi:hypothetical protein